MSEFKELKELLRMFEAGSLNEQSLAEFIWNEYDKSAKPFDKLDSLEKFGILMSSNLLSTVYSLKMRSFQPIKGLKFNLDKDILKKSGKERVYELAEIRSLIEDEVTQATLIRHLSTGKLKGRRLSQRKTEIKESDLLQYVADNYPRKLESVKGRIAQTD